jgi:hypothetical protein
VEELRRILTDWLTDLHLVPAGARSQLGRYVGYYEPYATSHDDLDADRDFQEETRNAARALVALVRQMRSGAWRPADAALAEPRAK